MKTTVELPGPLVERAKRLAARESTSLRELVEAGLRHVLNERTRRTTAFELRDARVDGSGLTDEFAGSTWDEIRNASYGERGT